MGRVGTRSSASLHRGLTAYWRLEERDGYRYDSVGTNHLSPTPYVDVATGKLGDCAYFDISRAPDPYLSIAANHSLRTGDADFTFAAWVKLTDKTTYRSIAGKWTSTAKEWNLIYHQGIDRYQFSTNSDATYVRATTHGSPAADAWTFIVVWHDADANTINIQVNNGTVDTTASATPPGETTAGFYLGSRGDALPGWAGYIDEALFYRRVLSSAERTRLYNDGAGLSMVQTPNQYRHFHADVSAVGNYFYDAVRGGVLDLVNGSSVARFRLRNHGTGAYAWVDQNIRLTHDYLGTNTTVALISDTHFGYEAIDAAACMTTAVADIDVIGADHVFVLGDLTMDVDEYTAYKVVRATSAVPVANWHEIPGNHDTWSQFAAGLGYAASYYSVDIGNVRFLLLGGGYLTQEAVTWFEAQLVAASGLNVIILTHEPRRYTTRESNNRGGGWLPVRSGVSAYETFLNEYEWCAWISAHSHGFNIKGDEEPDMSNYYFRAD